MPRQDILLGKSVEHRRLLLRRQGNQILRIAEKYLAVAYWQRIKFANDRNSAEYISCLYFVKGIRPYISIKTVKEAIKLVSKSIRSCYKTICATAW